LLLSLMAYAGLRPGEATTVRWRDLSERTIYLLASKTQRERRVSVLRPLAQDLAEWRLACGRPETGTLIVPRPQIGAWTRPSWRNWTQRIYQPAAHAAGVTGDLRPYRLRGSFASLLLCEGRSLAYVAEQDGHSIATLATHYAGVLEERAKPRASAEQAIHEARELTSCAAGVPAVTGARS
jgi:integrase